MSKRTRLQVQGATIPRMDRTDIWIAGYHAAMVSAFAADVDISDESTPVYGYDATIDTRILNAGTLSLSQYEHPDKTVDILDILMGIDPQQAGLRGYKAVGSFVTDVVRATKHPTLEHYIAAELFPAWNCVLRPKQGDPKSSGVRNLDGRCAIPIEFRVADPDGNQVAIAMDVANLLTSGSDKAGNLASNNGGTVLAVIPDTVPNLGGKYALIVEVQQRDSNNKIVKSARLTPSTGMVTTAGLVTITNADVAGTPFDDVSTINHAHVYFLKLVTTSLSEPFILGDGINVRGRYDTVPPAAPTGIAATSGGAGLAHVTWVDVANSETGYELQKSTDAGSTWTSAAATMPADTIVKDLTGLASATYKFRVRAIANDEVSAWNTMGGTVVVA